MTCVSRFYHKDSVHSADLSAAVHDWMERLSDAGVIHTWALTRTAPRLTDSARGFVLEVDGPTFGDVHAALVGKRDLGADLARLRDTAQGLMDQYGMSVEPAADGLRSAG